MNIGDIIIKTEGGPKYEIKDFIPVSNEPGVLLKPLTNGRTEIKMIKVYLEYFINSGIYIIENNNRKKINHKRFRLRRKRK